MQSAACRVQNGRVGRRRSSFWILPSAFCVFLPACSAPPAVSVQPHGGPATLRQSFDRAFVNRTSTFGEDQIVLVTAPIDRRLPDRPDAVIRPLPEVPLNTVMSIRLHWRANSSRLRSIAGLNAVLHWYVYGSPAGGGPPSLLHYVGTGFVTLNDAGDGADVSVTHGTLSLRDRHGDLRDPLGTFTVDGSFHAVTGDRQLAQTLADVKAAAEQSAAAFPSPPTSRPTTRP